MAVAKAALCSQGPDVAVVDVTTGWYTASFDLAEEIHQEAPDLPVVVLAGLDEDNAAMFSVSGDGVREPHLTVVPRPAISAALAEEIESILAPSQCG